MTKRLVVLAILALLAVADAAAHERFRIVGTVGRRQADMIEIATKEGRKAWVAIDKKTVVTREGKKVAAATLKAGESVVVDALGDDASDLVAQQIRVVPPIAATPKKN
jgi:RES domain-containing protein